MRELTDWIYSKYTDAEVCMQAEDTRLVRHPIDRTLGHWYRPRAHTAFDVCLKLCLFR